MQAVATGVDASPPDSASAGRRVSLYPSKRALDVLLALIGLTLLLPVIAVVAVVTWVDTGLPVLFRAPRLGKDGRIFTMYKFRTMSPDAAARLEEIGHLNIGQGMVKIPGDPRVTPTGRVLRKFSLDELPQLWNVVRGEMSLVGPRPHDPSEISVEDETNQLRLSVRPGLAGLWQVSARSNPFLATRVHYDLEYLRQCSLLLDWQIMFRTLYQVAHGSGDQIQLTELPKVLEHTVPLDLRSADLVMPDTAIEPAGG